jgi:copper homeostasis protein
MIIEICANSFESAYAAQKGGANRIELCTNLSVGGLTPSRELINKIRTELAISTHVLIRPRGGDFVYSTEEFQTMLDDIKYCKAMGCAGVVSGVLTTNGDINFERNQQLIKASEGMEFTFHRAFDVSRDPLQALEDLKLLGLTRLLSSGQEAKAIDGIELLKELKRRSEDKIQIMPGSGINKENALAFKNANFDSIHFSAIQKSNLPQSTSFFETGVEGTSDLKLIREMISLLA